jgi:DNA-binding MarR family transcriptional regulator
MNTHFAQQAQELTAMIQTLVQKFLGIHQTLNAGYVGMSKQELNIVGIVGRRGSAIMREIAEEARLAVSSVTPIIDRFVEKKSRYPQTHRRRPPNRSRGAYRKRIESIRL